MKITKPHYFDQFRCIAGHCPDSCCHEWEVDLDDTTAHRYLSLPGALGDQIRQKLKQSDDGFYLEITDSRCPMWRVDGLCQIQYELGHDALCQTCRDFPRLRHDYGDFVELGLELSCPEAARIILTAPEQPPVTLEHPGGETPDYDPDTMAVLLATRETALSILRRYDIPTALSLLLLYGAHAQADVDAGQVTEFDEKAALSMLAQLDLPAPAPLPAFYAGLELLTDRWRSLLACPHPLSHWPEELRAMARCQIHRYWLQAVSDWDLAARVKMIVASCILVQQLGGDVIATAQLYSKEIDNDSDNVDAILDAAYTSPALTDMNLLSALSALKE